jgi:hypothetical protein
LHRVPERLASNLSPELQAFIQQRLPTLEQIEIVLLLRSDVARSWTAPEVASTLGTPPESAAMRLFLLASSGLIVFEAAGVPRYRYNASDPEVDRSLAELSEVYSSDRPAVAALIGAPPPDPIRSFADAFKLKK